MEKGEGFEIGVAIEEGLIVGESVKQTPTDCSQTIRRDRSAPQGSFRERNCRLAPFA